MDLKEHKTDCSISFFPDEEDGLGFVYKKEKAPASARRAAFKLGIAAAFLGIVSIFIFTPPEDEFPYDEYDESEVAFVDELGDGSVENGTNTASSSAELAELKSSSLSLAALTSSSSVTAPIALQEEPVKTESRTVTLTAKTDKKDTEINATVRKGDSLIAVLKRNGLKNQEATLISMEMNKIYKLKNLRPKQTVAIIKDKDKAFRSLVIADKQGNKFSVVKDETGAYLSLLDEAKIEIRRSTVSGTVNGTFSETADSLNISKAITAQLVKAFSDTINFRTDTKNGDRFELVFEERFNDAGENIGGSKLLFASLSSGGKTYNRYYFKSLSGDWDYYDENGNRTKQALNIWPAGKNKVTSRFGTRRHPILLYPIHHSGIDVGVPIGTPVEAAADGKVVYVGTRGGYGRYVQIKHGSGYATAYAHLNSYASGLKAGDFVKQGSVIAYSGNTGRSTGPHLHFEVIKNGKKVDPLGKGKFFITDKLKGKALKQFIAECDKIKKPYSFAAAEKEPRNPVR